MRHVVPVIVLAVVLSARVSGRQVPGEELRIDRSADGVPVVRVEVEGEALRFAIDTGTSRTLVSAEAARRLRLIPRESFTVASAAGASRGGLCAAPPDIRLGGLRILLDCLGWIAAETRLAGAEDVDGLLGADALAGIDLWMDVTTSRLRARVAPSGSLAPWVDGRRLRIDLLGRRPVLAAEIVIPGQRGLGGRLIVDSGSDALILFGALARRLDNARIARQSGGSVVTPTGTRAVRIAAIHGVRIAGTVFETRSAALLPDVLRPEDGLLPLYLLGPVLLDLANGSIVAQARFRRQPISRYPDNSISIIR
jgi:hypothetical protein